MKKRVFILIVALLSAVTSFGQTTDPAVPGSAPRGEGCVDDAEHPIAGKSYTYTAASNQTGTFTFWATKDPTFISTTGGVTSTNMATTMLKSPTSTPTGTDLIATSSNYATANASPSVDITWSDAIIAGTVPGTTPTFVAALNDGTCTNNFKAWQILPILAFTVDIRNIDNAAPTGPSLAYDIHDDQCFDAVRGAVWNGTTVQYDYGTQVLYYEVIAANFTNSWTPTFQISGLGNGQTATIAWDIDKAFSNNPAPVAITNGTPVTTSAVTTAETSTTNGVSIYVKVTVSNNTYEGINATAITLAVDGQNSQNQWDIDNGDGTLCASTTGADQKDVATQDLNVRPTETPVTPPNFLPGNQTN